MAKKKAAPHRATRAEKSEPSEQKASTVPTYETDGEIKAARLAHGPDYDRLILNGAIAGPTRDELSDTELDERLAKAEAKRAE